MHTSNKELKTLLKAYKLHQWELAQFVGIGEATLVRRLRAPLPAEEMELLKTRIKELAAAKAAQNA